MYIKKSKLQEFYKQYNELIKNLQDFNKRYNEFYSEFLYLNWNEIRENESVYDKKSKCWYYIYGKIVNEYTQNKYLLVSCNSENKILIPFEKGRFYSKKVE